MESFFTRAQQLMGKKYSFPTAFGWLLRECKAHARGETSREHFSAHVAQQQMLFDSYLDALCVSGDAVEAFKAAMDRCHRTLSSSVTHPTGAEEEAGVHRT